MKLFIWLSAAARRRRKLQLPDTASEGECAEAERAEELAKELAKERAKELAKELAKERAKELAKEQAKELAKAATVRPARVQRPPRRLAERGGAAAAQGGEARLS
jgi:hypothetical protein